VSLKRVFEYLSIIQLTNQQYFSSRQCFGHSSSIGQKMIVSPF